MIVIVMGVSGCGKSTIGQALAARLGCTFLDADDFHPPENVAKMRGGIPLDDTDRAGWLDALRREIDAHLQHGTSAVLACSALKEKYRQHLRPSGDAVKLVYLRGDFETIAARLTTRTGHYMPTALLRSQFDTLEEPSGDVIVVPIEVPPADAVERIMHALVT